MKLSINGKAFYPHKCHTNSGDDYILQVSLINPGTGANGLSSLLLRERAFTLRISARL
jgi:hypothetical protein